MLKNNFAIYIQFKQFKIKTTGKLPGFNANRLLAYLYLLQQ